ncbi:MAG TPA: hypothetical protein VF627_03020 [Abditibacterium sp.]|jgi:hypothetical protein
MSVQELEAAVEKLSPAEVERFARWLENFRASKAATPSAFSMLREAAGSVEMPSDWATQHDHYLTGAPKRDAEQEAS